MFSPNRKNNSAFLLQANSYIPFPQVLDWALGHASFYQSSHLACIFLFKWERKNIVLFFPLVINHHGKEWMAKHLCLEC